MEHKFFCDTCKQEKIYVSDFTIGYSIDNAGKKRCFDCCGILDKKEMETASKFTLYLNTGKKTLSNWCGTFIIPIGYIRKGNHNFAKNRYDVWFKFAGKNWHGTTYGNFTQICHLRVTK